MSGEFIDVLHGPCKEAIEAIREDLRRVVKDRDLWKERHDRERAAHARNLTEQQRVEAERDKLRAAIQAIIEIDERGETLGPGHFDGLKAIIAGARSA